MQFKPFTLVDNVECETHFTGGGEHPEVSERVTVIRDRLTSGVLNEMLTMVKTRPAERKDILAIHNESYLFRLEEAVFSGKLSVDHSDNQISYETFDVAMLSAGGGLTGIDLLEGDKADLVFCNMRPPGHHAESGSALGFCFFNNAAIAARYWQKKYNREKIFIIDWDAHHGNGIQSAFEEDSQVFYVSIHEHPTFSFPGTGYAEEKGIGEGKNSILNIPLSPGATDSAVLKAIVETITPAIENFQPDALIVAAGFDGHQLDDMSALSYSTNLYGQLGVYMSMWGQKYCRGKVLSILEGGYHLEALAASVEAYIAGLCAVPPE